MKDKLIEVLREALEMESDPVELGDNFREYANWDSLSQLTLIALLDEHFGVSIPAAAFKELNTVQDLLGYVEKNASVN
jgi:acyl carrier protein